MNELDTLHAENARLRQQLADLQSYADLGNELVTELWAIVERQDKLLRFYQGDDSVLKVREDATQQANPDK